MFRKLRQKIQHTHLSLRTKMILSFSGIAIILLISSIISIMEYRRMSHYLSELIADNINSINVAQNISNVSDAYNLKVLEVVGDENVSNLPPFDQEQFIASCQTLKNSMTKQSLSPLADSVLYAYSAYMLTSLEVNDVILSDFIDSRTWFVDRLQPRFNRLQASINTLSSAIYSDLKHNSETFDRGFYRSIIPGAVAVAVGILLVMMLLLFILLDYVRPLRRMLDGLDNYRSFNRKYTYTFDGDDELVELNKGISEIIDDNRQLKQRLNTVKERGAKS